MNLQSSWPRNGGAIRLALILAASLLTGCAGSNGQLPDPVRLEIPPLSDAERVPCDAPTGPRNGLEAGYTATVLALKECGARYDALVERYDGVAGVLN